MLSHRASCALNRFLKCIHCSGDVLFEWVRYENVIVLRVAVIGTSAREVIDSIVCVIAAARPISRRAGRWCTRRRRLLSEKNRCSGHGRHHCRDFIEVPASSVDLHNNLLHGCVIQRPLRHTTTTTASKPGILRDHGGGTDPWNTFTICGIPKRALLFLPLQWRAVQF
jgi:hypothetical protein